MVIPLRPLLIYAMVTNGQKMARERDGESGQYRTAYTDQDFLSVIREGDQPSTPEVADALGCADRTALVRLHELADEGKVEQRKVGAVNLWLVGGETEGSGEDRETNQNESDESDESEDSESTGNWLEEIDDVE